MKNLSLWWYNTLLWLYCLCAINSRNSSKPAQFNPLCFYLIAELERESSSLCCSSWWLLMSPRNLCHVIQSKGFGRSILTFTGDFLIVSEHRWQEKEDGPISQLCVERVDSNSGPETRQGQKKGSGRWNRDRSSAGCCSGTSTKILYSVTGQEGEGLRGLSCTGWGELAVCVIVYHISIDHSHPN